MKPIPIPARYNYIAAFLTLSCNLRCSYCINDFGGGRRPTGRHRSAAEWIQGLNRLTVRPDLPVTLQGGEPSLHPGFFEVLRGLRADLHLDVLTNLTFDAERLIREIRPERLRRDAPYASIRVSYHPETMALDPLLEKVLRLQDAGFSVGIWGVLHPLQQDEIRRAQERCREAGVDFRTKEFLGEFGGRVYGNFLHPEACAGGPGGEVLCRTTELLIGPGGEVFRCHSDLYAGRSPVGQILDPEFAVEDVFRPCREFGHCNPCDVKVKTNRFQEFGHTSVEITDLYGGVESLPPSRPRGTQETEP